MRNRNSIACAIARLVAMGLLAVAVAPWSAGAQTCSYTALSPQSAVMTTTAPQNFTFTQTHNDWALVAVRSSGLDDWDANVFQSAAGPPACVSGLLGYSTAGSGVDFVIGDFTHNPLGTYYFQASRWTGSSAGQVEWSEAGGHIAINGGVGCHNLGPSHITIASNVDLRAGTTYTITFSPSGPGSLKLLLFRNPGGGTYWASRGDRVFEVTSTTTYTAPADDNYCLVVVNDNGLDGSFELDVNACTGPVSLTSESSTTANRTPIYYQFDQVARYWSAVGVRSTEDWDIDVWGSGSGDFPYCFSGLLANSLRPAPYTDFVIGDFNTNSPGTYYVRSYFAGSCLSTSAKVEWDGGPNLLALNGKCNGRNLGADDVLATWDVYLNAGTTYGFELNAYGASGYLSAPRLLLFRNPTGGTYWSGRSGAEFDLPAQSRITYTAPSGGFYGVVALNEGGESGFFDPRVWTCTEPLALSANTPVTITPGYADFSFTQTVPFWMAVGVRCDSPTSPWYVDVFDRRTPAVDSCLAGYRAGSHVGAPRTNFVVGNNISGTRYAEAYDLCNAPHTGYAHVVWDPSEAVLRVNDPLTVRTTGPDDFLRVWDVSLEAGTSYRITFNPSGANLRLCLFRNVPGGTVWASRDQAVLEVSGSTDYTAPATGYYGVVVVNDDGAAGEYSLGVGTCSAVSALSAGVVSATSKAENYYSIVQTAPYWTAVGVRGASDWDLEVCAQGSGSAYPACFAGPLSSSGVLPPAADFVVGDFDYNPIGTYYVRPHLYLDLGSGTAAVEWDSGMDQLNPGSPAVVRQTGANDLLECWDALLQPQHAYQFVFTSGGSADLKLAVFRNPVAGVYWAGRADAQIVVSQTTTWTTPAGSPQFYGLVVVNDNGLTGSYSLQVLDQGGVDVEPSAAPRVTELRGVRPNPARGPLQIHFALHEAARVRFDVLDLAGRRIAAIAERDEAAGTFSVAWEGSAGDGLRTPPGLYIVRMIVNGRPIGQRRVVLLD